MENVPTTRPRKAQGRGIERRERILDAARQTLMQQGVGGLVLRDIAAQLGITHGNLQYYFSTKEELLFAVFERELGKYTAALHNAVAKSSGKQDRLYAILDGALKELESDSTILWRMLIGLSGQNQQLAELHRDLNGRYDAELCEELHNVVPEWPRKKCLRTAQMIRVMLDGLAIQMNYDAPDEPAVRDLQLELKRSIASWFD